MRDVDSPRSKHCEGESMYLRRGCRVDHRHFSTLQRGTSTRLHYDRCRLTTQQILWGQVHVSQKGVSGRPSTRAANGELILTAARKVCSIRTQLISKAFCVRSQVLWIQCDKSLITLSAQRRLQHLTVTVALYHLWVTSYNINFQVRRSDNWASCVLLVTFCLSKFRWIVSCESWQS